MIKKLLILMLVLLLVPTIFAFEFDNIQNIKETKGLAGYNDIEIKNMFGLGKILWSGTLDYNTETCGKDCEARTDITLHEDGSLVDDIIFKTLQEDESWIEQPIRSYKFYIETGVIQTEVPEYEWECEDVIDPNGTEYESCIQIQTGTGYIDSSEWREYELGEILEAGDYTLKLVGEKKPSRTVDWIIKTSGIWADEWAVWGEGTILDTANLKLYYTFENQTESISGTNNLVADRGTPTFTGTGCKVGDCTVTSEAKNWIINYDTCRNFTIGNDATACAWVLEDTATRREMFWFALGTDDNWKVESQVTTGNLNWDGIGGGIGVVGTAFQDGVWKFVCISTNSTHITTWEDGEVTAKSVSATGLGMNDGPWHLNRHGSSTSFDWRGKMDEMSCWDEDIGYTGIQVLYNSGDGTTLPFAEAGVTLNSPQNNFISASSNIQVNCSAEISGGATLVNRTAIIYNLGGTINQTNVTLGLSGTSHTANSSFTLVESNYNWTCQYCDSDGDCGFGENRSISIDNSAPLITVNRPEAIEDFGVLTINQTLNWSIIELNLGTILWDYNGTNTTLYGNNNQTTFTLESNLYNGTLWANDSLGNMNSSFVEWEYKVFLNNETFNSVTTEGATETFSINFTKLSSLQVSTVSIVYNGTLTSFPYLVNGDEIISESSIVIPEKTSEINVSFFWNIRLDDGSSINTTAQNQTIQIIQIDNCDVFTNLIYNFTQYDEENKTILNTNTTMEVQINLYDISKTINLVNFSQTFNQVNPAQICMENPLLTTVNYSSYVIIKYDANLTTVNKSYSVEYHNILNETIGNLTVPKNVALYNLLQKDTTKFRLTFRDSSYVLSPNILVNVYRQYVEDNDFKIVEIPLTDSNGQTMLNLVKNDIVYNFIMVNEAKEIIAVFNSVIPFCQDFTIGECTMILAAESSGESAYNYNEEFNILISEPEYDNSTQLISIDFVTGDLNPISVTMDVFRNNDFGNRSVCSDTLIAASGTLSCGSSSITDTDNFLFTYVTVNGSLATQDTINLDSQNLNFGIANGAFYALLLILFLITMFMEDKKILVVSLGLGWIIIIPLGLINGKIIGAASSGIWVIVTIAIFLWKLNKEDTI